MTIFFSFAKKFAKLPRYSKKLLSLLRNHDALLQAANHCQTLAKRYPSVDNIYNLVGLVNPKNNFDSLSLDLGCGEEPRNPFGAAKTYGVDIRNGLGDMIKGANLALEPIPFASNTFTFCTAYDFIEHIPRVAIYEGKARFCLVELMNEIYRVLKDGGYFLHSTPAYPSKEAFQDPTHVNYITEETMPYYFCLPDLYAKKVGYGYTGQFELVAQVWVGDAWLVSLLKAVK